MRSPENIAESLRTRPASEPIRAFLPPSYGSELQIRQGSDGWRAMPEVPGSGGHYEADWTRRRADQEVRLRYRHAGRWKPLFPTSAVENLNGRFFSIADVSEWSHEPVRTGHAKVCLECTLEGLVASFEMGRFFTAEMQDLLLRSIADRILAADIPQRLAALGVDEIMAPVFPSVANRALLNPKFNYLVYAVGEVDWQIGRPAEFARLLDDLTARGIAFVPDMIFAHFVKAPSPTGLDSLETPARDRRFFVDPDPFLFRDYGTWMFDLENPEVRSFLIGKIVDFVTRFRLRTIRVDFVDGIILQYSRRGTNYGEILLRELRSRFDAIPDPPIVIGEAFSTAGNAAVRELIDVFYCPRGFCFVEELYKPARHLSRARFPEIGRIAEEINGNTHSESRDAIYAMLHDECWSDEHIAAGRPHVPWAYAAHPAELARRVADDLIAARLLAPRDTLDFVRKRVRAAEALTMFSSNLRYIYTPAVDSLALGRLDEPGRWRMEWSEPEPTDMRAWLKTGLDETRIFALHDRHRREMAALRRIFRESTEIKEARHTPLIRVSACHVDPSSSVLGVLRRHRHRSADASLVIFNFGPLEFPPGHLYEFPIPPDLGGLWRVWFDGDHAQESELLRGEGASGYAPGSEIWSGTGKLFGAAQPVLHLDLKPVGLLVLEKIS